MKLKTSITLSEDILKKIEGQARKGESRSGVVERLLRECLLEQSRRDADAKDLEILNKNAKNLAEEALDVLEYQEED
jgi:metal-responsive CopG/Arc/MetJ family transcriptional regulator